MSDSEKTVDNNEMPNPLKQVPINRIFPDDLKSHFVTHFVAQNRADHFILSAFEIWPPIIMGTDEERQETLNALESIDAKCVGRWVMSPSTMIELVQLLQNNLDKFLEHMEPAGEVELHPNKELK